VHAKSEGKMFKDKTQASRHVTEC